MRFLKLSLSLSFLVIGLVVTMTLVSKPDIANGIKNYEVYNFNTTLNEKLMEELPEVAKSSSKEKFNVENLTKDNTHLQMALKIYPDSGNSKLVKAEANGAFKIDGRSFGYEVEGKLREATNPNTNKTYYYGHIKGQIKGVNRNPNETDYEQLDGENGGFIIAFNVDNPNEFYIASTVGFQEFGQTTIYGDFDVYKKWEEAFKLSGGEMNWG